MPTKRFLGLMVLPVAEMKVKLRSGVISAKKMGKEAVGRGINWGFSPPHTLLPKEEKEEKIAFCGIVKCKKSAVKWQ